MTTDYHFLEDPESFKDYRRAIVYAEGRIEFFLSFNEKSLANKYRKDIETLQDRFPEYQL